ncbi:MAG: hypothetical protein HYZ47_01790 [Simkania negevensis]|nr:hypothetical protein [Simkania negevensis]
MTSDGSTRILQSPLARHPIRNGDIENPLPITTSSPSSSNRLTGKVETLWVWGQKDWKHVVVLAGGSAVLLCSMQDLFQGRVFKATLQVGGGAIAFYFIQDLRQVQEEQLERFKTENGKLKNTSQELQKRNEQLRETNEALQRTNGDLQGTTKHLQSIIQSVETEFQKAVIQHGTKAIDEVRRQYIEQIGSLREQTGSLKQNVTHLETTKEQLSEQTEALKSQVILAGKQLDEFRRKTEEEREAFLKQLKEAQTQFQKILEERVKEASTQGAKTDHALEQIKGVAQQMSSAISGVVRRLTPPSSPTFSSSKSSLPVIHPLNITQESSS